jgi:hypothetical protein
MWEHILPALLVAIVGAILAQTISLLIKEVAKDRDRWYSEYLRSIGSQARRKVTGPEKPVDVWAKLLDVLTDRLTPLDVKRLAQALELTDEIPDSGSHRAQLFNLLTAVRHRELMGRLFKWICEYRPDVAAEI